MNKRGNVGLLVPIVSTLFLIGVLIGVSSMILSNFQNSLDTDNVAASIVNETVGPVTPLAYSSYANYLQYKNGGSCSAPCASCVINESDGAVVPVADYYISGCSIKLNNTNSTAVNFTGKMKVSYAFTYSRETTESNATYFANKEIYNIANTWATPIITIIIAGILAGLVWWMLKSKTGAR